MKDSPRLIGLTGTNGAGKGEAAAYFEKAGYARLSLSDVIRDELRKTSRRITRLALIRKGNDLREAFGADVLARRVMAKVRGDAVIDSIRNSNEVAFFRRQPNFTLLAIDAPAETRFGRAKKRGRDESASTLDEFIAREEEEMTGSDKGQQLRACMRLADETVINAGTLEEFHRQLERFL